MVITLSDFEGLKVQLLFKNVELNKKRLDHWQNKIYWNLKVKLLNYYPMRCLE